MTTPLPVFDGHNDLLLRLYEASTEDRDRVWLQGDGGQLDLPRMRRGGFAGGLFAIYVPSPEPGYDRDALMSAPPFDVPLPEMIEVTADSILLNLRGVYARTNDLIVLNVAFVPEPSTSLLVALGLVALAAHRRHTA